MRITPIEIRQKTFEAKAFRGIDKDEVQAFLTTLSQEWDKLMEENRQQKIALERAESQVAKLREVETGLYHTLKTAQDTSQSMTQQAQQDAQTVRSKAEQEANLARTSAQQEATKALTDARQEADKVLTEARNTAKKLVEDAQRETERVTGALQTRFADLEREHRQLQGHFDKLLADLRAAATTALDRADSAQATRTKAGPPPTPPVKSPGPPTTSSPGAAAVAAPVTSNPPPPVANKESAPALPKPAAPAMPAVLTYPPVAGGPHPGMPEIAPIQPSVVPVPTGPSIEPMQPEITPQRQPQPMQPEPLPPTPAPTPQPAPPSPVPQPMNVPLEKPAGGGSFFDEI